MARRSLKRYRERGLDELERAMVAAGGAQGLEGARVLEIGGGIGALQAELLEAGAGSGEIVELVPAWEPYARELAREKGLEQRVEFRIVDVIEEPGGVVPADVVVLNRVVCCTPDGVRLTSVAASLARRTLVLSFPRDRFLVRSGLALVNGFMRALGRSYRTFLHPRTALVAAAEDEGLTLAGADRGFLWEFVALRRPA
jgi:magnesium-protoporphyrin O-methyltransferase